MSKAKEIAELGDVLVVNNGDLTLSGAIAATFEGNLTGDVTSTGTSSFATVTTTGNTTVGGDLLITGNLQVDGTTTIINSTNLTVDDLNITLASGAANATAANGAGLTVDGANATIVYDSVTDSWDLNKSVDVVGNLTVDTNTLFVDATSNSVGIRTTSPAAQLDVVGAVRLTNTANAANFGTLSDGGGLVITSGNNNPMYFNTGGSERLRITSAGNVGIGTTTPGSKLVVVDTNSTIQSVGTAGYGAFYAFSSGTNSSYMFFANAGGDTGRITSNDDGSLAFSNTASNTERMRISSTGNVGIGTSSPATKFAVSDSGAAGVEIIPSGVIQSFNRSTSAYQTLNIDGETLTFRPNGAEAMRITNGGRVGIGTTSPAQALHVIGAIQASTFFQGATDGTASAPLYRLNDANTGFFRPANNEIGFTTNGTERMRIDASGNVGIGTSSPVFGLTVEKDNGSGYVALFRKSVSDPALTIQTTGGVTQLQGLNAALNAVHGIAMQTSGGNVGIGTGSPSDKLTIVGGNIINPNNSGSEITSATLGIGGNIHFHERQPNGAFSDRTDLAIVTNTGFGLGESEKMRLDAAGNVGIGIVPSAWANFKGIQVQQGSLVSNQFSPGNLQTILGSNIVYDGVYKYIASDYASYYNQFAGAHVFFTAPLGTAGAAATVTERLRIDTSGNVGIGTSSPGAKLVVAGGWQQITNGSSSMYIGDGVSLVSGSSASASAVRFDGDALLFSNSNTERMRIDASGTLLVGSTDTALSSGNGFKFFPAGSGGGAFAGFINGGVGGSNLWLTNTNGATTSWTAIQFNRQSSVVGSITCTTTSTSYNTSSDYRLKENVVPLTNAADRLVQIPVHRFNFTADPYRTVDGFLAHEVQAIVPESITGTKDEVDDEGNPKYQGIDQSKLVPLLTAALQEALNKIENLENRLNQAGL